MTDTMRCSDRRESIAALVLGLLDAKTKIDLQRHIDSCSVCRGVRDALVGEEQTVKSAFESLARGFRGQVEAIGDGNRRSSNQPAAERPAHRTKGVWKMILAHKRLTSAAAAVLIAVLALGIVVMLPHGSPAYALEQTTQAVARVKYYHVKITPPGAGVGEAWAELDDKGEVVRLRIDSPKSEDGAKVAILSAGVADVWFKDKKIFMILRDDSMAKMFASQRGMFDPKIMFEHLVAVRDSGKAKVETQEPARKGDPVTLTVTTEGKSDLKDVYLVNAQTKLVEQFSKYERKDGDWKLVSTIEYLDYDKKIEKSIWEPELPKDVMRIDQTTGKIGVEKGDLKDNEIAKKAAREFFEALIAGDYEKAGQIAEGIPGDKMKEIFGKVKWLRIVELREPKPHPDEKTKFLQVPVKMEFEDGGKTATRDFMLNTRAAHNQPGRWIIGGGF